MCALPDEPDSLAKAAGSFAESEPWHKPRSRPGCCRWSPTCQDCSHSNMASEWRARQWPSSRGDRPSTTDPGKRSATARTSGGAKKKVLSTHGLGRPGTCDVHAAGSECPARPPGPSRRGGRTPAAKVSRRVARLPPSLAGPAPKPSARYFRYLTFERVVTST